MRKAMNKDVSDNYFTGGWTEKNIRLLARAFRDDLSHYYSNSDSVEMTKEILANYANIGGSEVRKLYETNNSLVWLSRESTPDGYYEVIDIINKLTAETEMIEL